MYIRNIYSTPPDEMNQVDSFHNPVSLTIPDDSLTVKELFSRYMDGTLERSQRTLERRLEFDGYNPDIDMDLGPDSLVDAYDRFSDSVDTPVKDVSDSTEESSTPKESKGATSGATADSVQTPPLEETT